MFFCSNGKVVLPLPSIEVLSEAAQSSDHRGMVIHIMESSVIAWMRQVKVSWGETGIADELFSLTSLCTDVIAFGPKHKYTQNPWKVCRSSL